MILSSSKNPNNRLKAKKTWFTHVICTAPAICAPFVFSRVRKTAATLAEKHPLAATFRKLWSTHQQVGYMMVYVTYML
jgi:hypothetical protein